MRACGRPASSWPKGSTKYRPTTHWTALRAARMKPASRPAAVNRAVLRQLVRGATLPAPESHLSLKNPPSRYCSNENGSNPIACRALPSRRRTQQPPAVRETRRRRACGLRARSLDPAARARAAEPLLGLSRRPPLTDFAHLCALLRSSQARVRPVEHLPGRIFRRGKFWHDRSDTPGPPRPKNTDLKMSSKSDLPYASESPLTGPNLILPAPPYPS